jgi:hypothetical protein
MDMFRKKMADKADAIRLGPAFEKTRGGKGPVGYIGLGEDLVYPKVIQSLLERVSTLESEFNRLLNDTKLLRDVVRDIHEEGDII